MLVPWRVYYETTQILRGEITILFFSSLHPHVLDVQVMLDFRLIKPRKIGHQPWKMGP